MVPSPDSSPLHRQQIRIDQREYDRLVLWADKYDNLCENLIRGGVDEAAIHLLSQRIVSEKNNPNLNSLDSTEEEAHSPPTSTVVDYRGRSNSAKESDSYYSVQSLEYETDVESESHSGSFVSDGHNSVDPDDSASVVAHRLSYQQDARRTVQLSNLPPNTIHSEVVAAVKGGPVVDIYVNLKERRAAVSFVHGEHAKRYYDFAQSTGIYMHGSHIKVSWSNRQFILAPYVAQQLRGGASRNLVLRYYDRRITAISIRNDLEHIHNLVVINIYFSGLDCYISTNSVTAASFARTCMMSRYPYRGSRIEWAPDECMESLDMLKPKQTRHPLATKMPASLNRFSLLDVEEHEAF